MVRAMKVMAAGLDGRHSFMEDYTYHLGPRRRHSARRPHAGDLPSDRRWPAIDSRSTRSSSAARPTRCDSSSMPSRAARSRPASPTWATASAWSRRAWTSSPPPQPLPKLPVARAVWGPARTSRRRDGLDPRRRRAPHGLRLGGHDGASHGLRRDGGHRDPRDRRATRSSGISRASCAGTTSTGASPKAGDLGHDGP